MKNILKQIFVAFAIILLSKSNVQAGSFAVMNQKNPTVLSCNYGDRNCKFYAPVIFSNITGKDMYNTTLWTQGSVIEYTNNYGVFTKLKSIFPAIYEPGLGPNVLVKVIPNSNMAPGTSYKEKIYIDGRECNKISGILDCYYYGASTFEVILRINPVKETIPTLPIPIPSARPYPTKL